MSAVDSVDSLVVAAAQAAGPCPPGEEAAWGRRVQALVVDLHLIAQQARQDIARLESAATFAALVEKVEIEESSRRGLVTLRLPSGESEQIRTEQEGTDRGRALIERARSLTGHWALVYRYNERKAGQRAQSVRMLAHLLDLGGEGAVPATTAKKIVLDDAGGDVARAQRAWQSAGLPPSGTVSVDELERARSAARAVDTDLITARSERLRARPAASASSEITARSLVNIHTARHLRASLGPGRIQTVRADSASFRPGPRNPAPRGEAKITQTSCCYL